MSSFSISIPSGCSSSEKKVIQDLQKLGDLEIQTDAANQQKNATNASLGHGSKTQQQQGDVWAVMATALFYQMNNCMSGSMSTIAMMSQVVGDVTSVFNDSLQDITNAANSNGTDINAVKDLASTLDFLTTTQVTVTVNGKSYQTTILPKPGCSDPSSPDAGLLCSNALWPNGSAPMDINAGNQLLTTVTEMKGSFTTWDDVNAMAKDFQRWSQETTDSATGAITGTDLDKINQLMKWDNQGIDQLGTSNTQLQNELSSAQSEQQEFQGSWKSMMDAINKQIAAMNSAMASA